MNHSRTTESTCLPSLIRRINVLGVGVSVLNMETTLEAMAGAIAKKQKGYICVTGVHGVSEAQSDPAFRHILNSAFLNTPDGMPLVWVGKLRGEKQMRRVYGPDLMLAVFEASRQAGYRHFFYGGANGTSEALRRRMVERFPGVQVVGTFEPPFRPLDAREMAQLREMLDACHPDIMWVGLSTPKQEKFMAENLSLLDTTLMIGVGAAFDFHAGRVRQAPRWMQRNGLEWFFRLCSEPRRLWKRYLKNNPLFLLRVFCQLTGLRKFPLNN